jgi:hypothetical protein
MIDLTKAIGAVAASVAALGGSYTLADKFGWFDRAIIEWSPENFKIVAEAGQPINVTVARIKKRDDCSVESFTPASGTQQAWCMKQPPLQADSAAPQAQRLTRLHTNSRW